ncbi:MAG: hypothetical protein R3F36_09235 [Candidatus Competibacteraceae bacterium]
MRDGRLTELLLAATGGSATALAGERPLPANPWRRDVPGRRTARLARITVLDQAGQAASTEVWISRGAREPSPFP